MKHYALAPILLLGACATTSEPAVRTVEVEVPVPMPCMTKEQLAANPEPPRIGERLGGTPETAQADRDVLAASALRLRAWGLTLFTALDACADE